MNPQNEEASAGANQDTNKVDVPHSNDAGSKDENRAHANSTTDKEDLIEQTFQVVTEFEAAAKELTEEDVQDDAKMDWVLSKLELEPDVKRPMTEVLRRICEEGSLKETIEKWIMVVGIIWDGVKNAPPKEGKEGN